MGTSVGARLNISFGARPVQKAEQSMQLFLCGRTVQIWTCENSVEQVNKTCFSVKQNLCPHVFPSSKLV